MKKHLLKHAKLYIADYLSTAASRFGHISMSQSTIGKESCYTREWVCKVTTSLSKMGVIKKITHKSDTAPSNKQFLKQTYYKLSSDFMLNPLKYGVNSSVFNWAKSHAASLVKHRFRLPKKPSYLLVFFFGLLTAENDTLKKSSHNKKTCTEETYSAWNDAVTLPSFPGINIFEMMRNAEEYKEDTVYSKMHDNLYMRKILIPEFWGLVDSLDEQPIEGILSHSPEYCNMEPFEEIDDSILPRAEPKLKLVPSKAAGSGSRSIILKSSAVAGRKSVKKLSRQEELILNAKKCLSSHGLSVDDNEPVINPFATEAVPKVVKTRDDFKSEIMAEDYFIRLKSSYTALGDIGKTLFTKKLELEIAKRLREQ